jgi:hypothetical protein
MESENVGNQVKRITRNAVEELQDRAVRYYRAMLHKTFGDDSIRVDTNTKVSRNSLKLIITTRWGDLGKNEHKET